MNIDGLTDAELDEALKVARDLSRYRSGDRALLARAFIAIHAELARCPALPPGAVDLNAHPLAEVLRDVVARADDLEPTLGGDRERKIAAEIEEIVGARFRMESRDARAELAALALLGLARNGGAP